jgi:hypothetical protein
MTKQAKIEQSRKNLGFNIEEELQKASNTDILETNNTKNEDSENK